MNRYSDEKNCRILVIDDNEAIHNDFNKILGRNSSRKESMNDLMMAVLGESNEASSQGKYAIDSAYQGQDGFEMVNKSLELDKPYAMAFVDIRMPPGWDGIQTIKHIWEVDPHLEVVICTAYSDYGWDEIHKTLKYPEQFVILKKPFDSIEVRQIASALTGKWNYARRSRLTMDELNEKVAERTEVMQKSNDALLKLNQTLKEKQKQLIQSEKMASLGLLAAGVAHEINNPIGFIMSNLGTLKDYVKVFRELFDANENLYEAIRNNDVDEISANLKNIEGIKEDDDISYILQDIDDLIGESCSGTERVRDIVMSLKSFARIDDAGLTDANINECIESTLKVVWNEVKYKCEVRTDLKPIQSIQCFPNQLNQVFMNIIVNAAHAIEEKGIIDISTEETNDSIIIKISDTGKGIPEENFPKLFDPFFTTKPVGKGTGLGLSISHGIIENHSGTIDVESEPGKGTTFTITLPIEGVRISSNDV